MCVLDPLRSGKGCFRRSPFKETSTLSFELSDGVTLFLHIWRGNDDDTLTLSMTPTVPL
jgi:hypothetical protein